MSRKVTLMIIPEGSQQVFSRTISTGIFRIILAVMVVWLLGMAIVTIYLSRLTVLAAKASMLADENNNLRGYLARVVDIEKSFKKNRELTARLAQMAGVDLEDLTRTGIDFDSATSELADTSFGDIVGDTAQLPIPLSNEELLKQTVPQGRPLYGWITRSFALEEGSTEKHTGLDFAVKKGTAVAATASGVVVFAGWDENFGNLVIVDHGNGYETIYGHNDKLLVEEGQNVIKGDVIALSGNTGHSSAPHLHYEVRKNGESVDPTPFLD